MLEFLEFPPAVLIAMAGVLFGIPLLYLIAGWLLTRQRRVCPTCGRRALRRVQWILATVIIDGHRAPDSWTYFLCESCGARFKQHLGRDLEIPTEAEWTQDCSNIK
ncbi:MAG: hypothetical protein WCS99_05635 [Limisphaerales bacterium]